MRIVFDVKEQPKDEVYAGQLRTDDSGLYAIVSYNEENERPFNAYLIAEDENDYGLHGSINWRKGTTADGIREEFPTIVDAELIIRGAK